ncbi:unnamed protein product [Darwinula stevensoni]|uniref:chitinase n=1 Tax=Darwinula stevensoni TaxID=69355 RepID=A0A7R9AGG0_9CRUS|nr:unnamed protein product [Darwinula stevensoni]CAG0903384.1 unnamed protein product [Darwinula stevensoni]
MSADAGRRSTFVASCVDLLKQYGFDGLDMDWEYPANQGGSPADKGNFVQLLRDLKAAFAPNGFLLTAAVSAGKNTIDTAYDVPGMSQTLDYISVMAYDMHGAFDSYTHHNAPLFALPLDQSHNNQYFNDDFAVRYWLSLGAPKEKLVMGMPVYGRGFTLADPSNNGFYAPTAGAGTAGPYTREAGILGFNEICEIQKQYGDFKRIWNDDIKAPYCTFNSNQWFGYDDTESITQKAQLIVNLGLAGGMVWSVETDDFQGKCGLGNNPILNTIKKVLNGQSPPNEATTKAPGGRCSSAGYFAAGSCSPKFYYCLPNNGQWIIYDLSCAAGTIYYRGSCVWSNASPECQG